MTEEPFGFEAAQERRSGADRRSIDRRSGDDRRVANRRSGFRPVGADRRSPEERRLTDRRSGLDRRDLRQSGAAGLQFPGV